MVLSTVLVCFMWEPALHPHAQQGRVRAPGIRAGHRPGTRRALVLASQQYCLLGPRLAAALDIDLESGAPLCFTLLSFPGSAWPRDKWECTHGCSKGTAARQYWARLSCPHVSINAVYGVAPRRSIAALAGRSGLDIGHDARRVRPPAPLRALSPKP